MSHFSDLFGSWGQRTYAAWNGSVGRYKYAREIQDSLKKSSDELLAEQLQRLKQIVDYACTHCLWYREEFSRVGFKPGDLRDFSDLAQLPAFRRDTMVRNPEKFFSDEYGPDERFEATTGGTSGVIFRFFRDKVSTEYRRGIELALCRYYGWKDGQWQGWLWTASQDLVERNTVRLKLKNHLVDRMYCLDTRTLNDETYRKFAQETLKYKPNFISAYPSLAYEMAEKIEQGRVPPFRVPIISVTAEPFYEFQRKKIEATCADNVYSRYGTREFGLAGFECPEKNGLHILTDSVYLEEIHDEDIPDNCGSILVTDLHNRAMPFIRYRIGDFGRIDTSPCPCGINSPRLVDLRGRELDIIWRPDGTGVAGFIWIMLITKSELNAKLQIVQTEIDKIKIKIEGRLGDYSNEIETLIGLIRETFGEIFIINFEETDEIKRAASGKYRFIVSEVKKPI